MVAVESIFVNSNKGVKFYAMLQRSKVLKQKRKATFF